MAYNFFLMLGMMHSEPEVAATPPITPAPGTGTNPSLVRTDKENVDQARQDNSHNTEQSDANLKTQLKQQASSGLSENVKSILGNRAIIARSESSASPILSGNNINTKAVEEIKLVQDALIKLGKLKAEDIKYGQYDEKTAEAVRSYQQEKHNSDQGFLVDGIVGFQTLNSLLRDVADQEDVKSDLGDEHQKLITGIEAAWNNGGAAADTQIRKIPENPQQRTPTVQTSDNLNQETKTANADVQATKGPLSDLAGKLANCKSPPDSDDIRAIQEALNIYVDSRRSGLTGFFRRLFVDLKKVEVDGNFNEATKELLGDFLHSYPDKKLTNQSLTKDVARHLLTHIVQPRADKEASDFDKSQSAKAAEEELGQQFRTFKEKGTVGPELKNKILVSLNYILGTSFQGEKIFLNNPEFVDAVKKFQKTYLSNGVYNYANYGTLDTETVKKMFEIREFLEESRQLSDPTVALI